MDYTRLIDILPYQLKNFPQDVCLSRKVNGEWKNYSTQQVTDHVNEFSRAFLKYGIKKDDKLTIICGSRPEWNFIDLGILQIGAVNVPVYPTISTGEYEYIFKDADIKLCIVETEELYNKVSALKEKVPTLQDIYTIEPVTGAKHISELLELGEGVSMDDVENAKAEVKPEDLATIIYTSGTTGNPKGVMLSHNNVVSNVRETTVLLNPLIDNTATVLSFLPLCHIFERMVLYCYLSVGASIHYAESLETIGADLQEVKPEFFTSVPRLLEKIYDKIVAKGLELDGIKRKLFFWALDLGLNYDVRGNNSAWYNFKLGIARKLIFSKWKAALGGNVLGIVTGAAALQTRLERVFNAAGIQVRQGYGQTESSPVITLNRFEEGNYYLGSVGEVIKDVEVKFDPKNGEILCKGPNVMMGYYNQPEKTAETIIDGWLHTGDVGELVDGKYLKITDRIKELFKTSGGKYVAPQVIENKLKESPLIEQVAVLGENQKFVSALVVPNEDNLKHLCKENDIEFSDVYEIANNKTVINLFEEEINSYKDNFNKWEQIKKFKLMPNQWTVETLELTPTMKLKRRVINEKYSKEIEELYNV